MTRPLWQDVLVAVCNWALVCMVLSLLFLLASNR